MTRSALQALTTGPALTTVEIKRATVVSSPVGGDDLDWDNPVTVTTVTGRKQPATAEQLERAGLQGLVDGFTWFLTDTTLIPETHRLYEGTIVYRVVRVDRWATSHVRAITEVIDSG